ncbi:MAG TPA: PIN domain nuclease, partial [Anaerolineales bacterium]|nr:PIN domain nuclease [Anaerolineales bacterium]
MNVSVEFILRIVGMIFIGIVAGIWGYGLGGNEYESIRYTAIIGLLGALTGLVLTPYVTTRPARAVRVRLGRLSAETLFAGLLGLIIGLLTAALLAFPLSLLPKPFGQIMPLVGVIAFAWLGISLFVMRQGDIMGLLSTL